MGFSQAVDPQACRRPAVVETVRAEFAGAGWMTAFNSMESDAGPLFKSVVRQIQEWIGIRDTEEPDATSR